MCITSSQNRTPKTNKISPQLSTTQTYFPQVFQSENDVYNNFYLTLTFLWIVDNSDSFSLSPCYL